MFHQDLRFAPRMLLLPAALAGAFALGSAASLAHAQEKAVSSSSLPAHQYDIKAGPLLQTLEAIGRISGQTIVFERAALANVQAGAVSGELSAALAVEQALSGTGYIATADANGALVVSALKVVVTARRDEAETSFKASRSDTATRSGTSLHLVPGGVTVITGKVLETRQATDLTSALRNVSGVAIKQSPQSKATFEIRGFTASSTSNGIADDNATGRDVFAVERIEVLKGPQAILSGSHSMGGGVNIVVKKPQAEPIRDLTLQYGSGQDKTAALDLSGALGDDPRLTYRTIGSSTDAKDSDAGFEGRERQSLMQAFRWKDHGTDVTVSAEYNDGRNPLTRYTFARRDAVIVAPPQRLLGHRDDSIDFRQRRVNFQLEQQFSDDTVLVSRLQHARDDRHQHVLNPIGFSYDEGAAPDNPLPLISFDPTRMLVNEKTTSGDHYLRMALRTGPVRHKLSTGFNHSDYSYQQTQFGGDLLDVPVYGAAPYTFPEVRKASVTPVADESSGRKQQALYVQDLMSYDKWNLLLNLRRDRYTAKQTVVRQFPDIEDVVPASRQYATTHGAGIVYQLNDQTALYASYATGFEPRADLLCGGGLVPPMQTRNRELGAKFDLLDSRFSLTTSMFSMQQSNVPVFFQIGNCFNLIDAQQTRGVEIDAQGRLAPGLEMVFNYTYNRLRDVADVKTAFPGYPKHKMSLWTMYDFQSAALKGVDMGLGITASSSSLGNIFPEYQFQVPGQAQLDASIYYNIARWSLTFGVKNVANRTLYGTVVTNGFVPLEPGRQFMLTAKRSFK